MIFAVRRISELSTKYNSHPGRLQSPILVFRWLGSSAASTSYSPPRVALLLISPRFVVTSTSMQLKKPPRRCNIVAGYWLKTGSGLQGDANLDGVVNGLDINLIAALVAGERPWHSRDSRTLHTHPRRARRTRAARASPSQIEP